MKPKNILLFSALFTITLASCDNQSEKNDGGQQDSTATTTPAVATDVSNIEQQVSVLLAAQENSKLLEYLKENGQKHPEMLTAKFAAADSFGMQILTSDDGQLRFYCWDDQTGGTARSFNTLVQYKTTTGSDVRVVNDASVEEEGAVSSGAFYSEIHTIQTESHGKVYLVQTVAIGSSKDVIAGIGAYAIENGVLNDTVKMFKTAKGTLSDISYYYDRQTNVDDKTGDQKNTLHLSEDKKTLYVPVVDNDGKVSGKSLVYKFDGNLFVFDKNAK